jgi:hypothetical protein
LEFKFNRKALERPYTSKHSWGKTYGEHKRHLEFSHDQYKELQSYAQEIGIFFTASGMDEVSFGCPAAVSGAMGCRRLFVYCPFRLLFTCIGSKTRSPEQGF